MTIQAVPIPEPAKDEAPKRGRGRPRKDASDTAPRTRRSSNPAVTEDAVGGLLFMVNMPLSMVPFLQADALTPDETTALAKGIVEQCKTSPAFKRYVQAALKMSGATGLIAPLSFILARRAIRHGILPGGEFADAQLGQMIGVMAGTVALTEIVPPPLDTSQDTAPDAPVDFAAEMQERAAAVRAATPAGTFETPEA